MPVQVDARQVFFGLLVAAFAVLAWLILQPFLSYVLAVLLFAFLLDPVQRRLAPRLGERVSALLLVAGTVVATAGAVAFLVLALPADASAVGRTIDQILEQNTIERRLESVLGVDVSLDSIVGDVPGQVADLLVGDISGVVAAVTDAFLGVVLLLFLLYYLLVDGDRLVAWVKRMLPLRSETTEELCREAHGTTWAVLKGHVFIAVVQGAVAGVGLLVVGLPNVAFWTVVMMFLELFPVIGVAGVLGPAVVYLALADRLLAAGFLAVYGLTAVAVVDDYLRAYVVDRESSLHSATILVGVFGGVYAFGVMGLFYGPIVLGLFQTLIQLFHDHHSAES